MLSLAQRCGGRGTERSAEFGRVNHLRCPHARARARAPIQRAASGWSASTDRLEPALRLLATSPFRFSGLLLADSGRGDDGARATGSTMSVDGGGAGAARGTGSSTTDRKICSTDSGGACSRSRSAAATAALNDHQNLAALTYIRCPHARANNRETRRLLTNRPGSSFSTKSPIPTNVYASAIGLCKDSIIMQSRKPSNSDF